MGYSIVIPEEVELRDNLKHSNMVTGYGVSLNGDPLYDPENVKDNDIQIVFVYSKNKNDVEDTMLKQQYELSMRKYNQVAREKDDLLSQLSREDDNKREREDELKKKTILLSQKKTIENTGLNADQTIREGDDRIGSFDPKVQFGLQRDESSNSNYNKNNRTNIKDDTIVPHESVVIHDSQILKPNLQASFENYNSNNLKASAIQGNQKRYEEPVDQLYRTDNLPLNERERIIYSTISREINKNEKAVLMTQGLYGQQAKEISKEHLKFVLDKELSDKNKAYQIIIHFLSYKSNGHYDYIPKLINFKVYFWDLSDFITDIGKVHLPPDKSPLKLANIALSIIRDTDGLLYPNSLEIMKAIKI